MQKNTISTPENRESAVAKWLLTGVGMLIIQILLGGITRLTGSGLSITEWKPIIGALPPLNEAAWVAAFDKYKTIAQYQYLNQHFTLSDFKHIYFWEWMHREWARLVGVVFAIGFIYFLIKKYFDERMVGPFIFLFLLGGLQGAIGWIMVQSGLNDTNLYVSHIRLAVHFIAALVLLCYTLWFALILIVPKERVQPDRKVCSYTIATIALLTIQLIYGAFMAGLKAAPAAPTWPTINGQWGPGDVGHYGNNIYNGLAKFTNNPVAVQFIHRMLAYLLIVVITGWYISARKAAKEHKSSLLNATLKWPLIAVLVQVILGILTVLHGAQTVAGHFGTFEILAEAHQLVAMLLLVAMIINLYVVSKHRLTA